MTAGTPWGLNPWSWCLWLSVWIRTVQIGKTIMSYTGCCCCCCCLASQRPYHIYPIPATPSAQFVRPCPHTLVTLMEHCVCPYSTSFSKFFKLWTFFCPLKVLHFAATLYIGIYIIIHFIFCSYICDNIYSYTVYFSHLSFLMSQVKN